jgi:purine-nucleoside phosphorylase
MSEQLSVPAEDVARVEREGLEKPRVAVVAGSGLSALGDLVEGAALIPYEELPGFPRPEYEVPGHEGRLVCGSIGGTRVVVFQGRVHRYQGFSARDAAYPARLAAALGVEILVVTNAAGGINPSYDPGSIVLIHDQMNLRGDNPLTGWSGPPGGVPFVPMRDAYDPELRRKAHEAAQSIGTYLPEGVYAGLLGPAFETPAEVAYLRNAGADMVGMSTVPEVICARALDLRVLGFSLVTNTAAGEGLSHDEVLEAGEQAAERMTRLTIAILQGL